MSDWIPGISQLKSLDQVLTGDVEGARRTQVNFSRQCPVISQVRSAVEARSGDEEAARETQLEFMRNVGDVLENTPARPVVKMADTLPGVSQMKSLAQATLGDVEGARRTQVNFSRRCPVISQVRSAAEALHGNKEAARETQVEFVRNAGRVLIDPIPVVGHIKGMIHYAYDDKEDGDHAIEAASRGLGDVISYGSAWTAGGPAGVARAAVSRSIFKKKSL